MDTYRLHYFPESGNSYKLALMLTLCGQTFEPVWTDFGSRVTWTPQWRRTVNPMGEIPVLEVNGRKLAAQYEKFGAINDEETTSFFAGNGVRFTSGRVTGSGSLRAMLHCGPGTAERGQVHFRHFRDEGRRGGRWAGRVPAKRRVLASTMARKTSRPRARCCCR